MLPSMTARSMRLSRAAFCWTVSGSVVWGSAADNDGVLWVDDGSFVLRFAPTSRSDFGHAYSFPKTVYWYSIAKDLLTTLLGRRHHVWPSWI